MPRPAIVIGVGGTGSWVLSWLKKDLLETHDTLDDLPVRLLLLDAADIIAEVGAGGGAGLDTGLQGYSRFITIEPEEFIRLPTNRDANQTRQLVSELQKMQHLVTSSPDHERMEQTYGHLARWFCADFFPAQALILKDGSGQFRQLGRLALVQGLHLNGANDAVYALLQTLIGEVARPEQGGMARSIDVHITGSLVGGTGSGIFLDVAWLVRQIAEKMGVDTFISGFFALPPVFGNIPTDAMRVKAFSAWRELNRMMAVDSSRTHFFVKWGASSEVIFHVNRPAYDHVYLVEGPAVGSARAQKPQDSVFPTMAEAISFFLDKYSGGQYIQHIRANIAHHRQRAEFRNQPVYSVFTIKTWKLPVHHYANVARHKLAIEFLRRLLGVEERQEVGPANTTRKVYRLRPAQQSFQRVHEIFQDSLGAANVGTTYFIELQEDIRTIREPERESEAERWAYYAHDLLAEYVQMPDTPEGNQVKMRLAPLVNFDLPPFHPSHNLLNWNSQIRAIHDQLYGVNNMGGAYQEIYGDFVGQHSKGKLFDELAAVQEFHLRLFRRRLQIWIDQELNSGREGALASVRATLEFLRDGLERNYQFLERVSEKLASPGEMRSNAETLYQQALELTQSHDWLKGLASRLGLSQARKTVNAWYIAERMHKATQSDHRAIERMLETVREMHDLVANEALPKVIEMEQQLVTDNVYERVWGLYRGLIESLEDEWRRHEFDQHLRDIELLEGEQGEVVVDETEIERLLERTRWTVDPNLNLRIEINVSDYREPIVLESNMRDPRQTVRLVRRLVEDVADRVLYTTSDKTALDVLGVDTLAKELLSDDYNAQAFRQDAAGGIAHEAVRTFYVRVGRKASDEGEGGISPEIRNAILDRLPKQLPTEPPNTADVVGSENPNKVVVFSAQEVLLPASFTEWQVCRALYQRSATGNAREGRRAQYERMRCDHLFVGEKNALALERRHYEEARLPEFPILNHRIVHILENKDRLDELLSMWTLGWVQEVQEGRSQIWTLVLPEPDRPLQLLRREDDVDMLDMLTCYTTSGKDLNGREIPYKRIQALLNQTLDNEWYPSQDATARLEERFRYESAVAKELSEKIAKARGAQVSTEQLKETLDAFFAKHVLPSEELDAHTTLARFVAYDLSRRTSDGGDLVVNPEAHEQMLGIVLVQTFDTLARKVHNFRLNKNWE